MRYADAQCQYRETYENGVHEYIYSGNCVVTGELVTVRIPGPALFKYRQGAYIQDAMPMLSADEREFLISGMGPKAWAGFEDSDDNLADEELLDKLEN